MGALNNNVYYSTGNGFSLLLGFPKHFYLVQLLTTAQTFQYFTRFLDHLVRKYKEEYPQRGKAQPKGADDNPANLS